MGARTILTRGATSGLRLGRGTADRVVRWAGGPLSRLADGVVSRVRRPQQGTTTTFTPSKRRTDALAEREQPGKSSPTPATVARNIAPPRPAAKQPHKTKVKGGPGAKLPPPRPSAT